MHSKVLQRPGGETLTNFLSKETLSTTVAVFGASREAALTHINQIKAFPLERFFANLSNKYVGLFFFEKKKLIIFGETYTNARRIIPLLGSRDEDRLQMAFVIHK